MKNRKKWIAACRSLTVLTALLAVGAEAQELQKIRVGNGNKAMTAINLDFVIPEYLGYYKAEGITVENIPLGSQAALFAALEKKSLELSIATSDVQVPMAGNGAKLPSVDYFESTYPFKYGLAVKPGSAYTKITDLKGKRIGVRGVDEIPVGKAVFKVAGFNPETDLSWLTVGDGSAAGLALERGDIDGLFAFDIIFGTIEAAKIKLNYLPLPAGIPMIAGLYLTATPEMLREHRNWAVGFARAVAKAHIFIQENPEAASYIFCTLVPEALPKGLSIEEQVASIVTPIMKRMPLYSPYDKADKIGYIKRQEWVDQIKFSGFDGKLNDPSVFFTNELIDEINNFDVEKVKAEARNFKLPYKK